ncbi:ATP-grasp domain-containing protein [Desulfotignum balticum]|uniref:ATP-grasp domain-containing protein n=1 Tax=Desulfotignum balticum TaxID=115781 RepID=UPI0004209BA6|nr:hypothetical protein [Desulfotignum balticum]
MKTIKLLVDYKGHFGSKWNAKPYRSGMNINSLKEAFSSHGYSIETMNFSEINTLNTENIKNEIFVYTGSEDIDFHYKKYIENIVYSIEIMGAKVIPSYQFLKATNNKVFMELIRKKYFGSVKKNLNATVYGTYEEMERNIDNLTFPIVVKRPEGAMSKGVSLAKNKKGLRKIVKQIARTKNVMKDIKDSLRPFKHSGYKKESLYRKQFLLQEFIPNLKNDWKILIFGDKYFIFSRPVRENDFRASGSGCGNYSYGSACEFPEGIFDYAKQIFETLKVPHLGVDIAYDGKDFYLIEFQSVFFGTVGYVKSDIYYRYDNGKWISKDNKHSLERIYADSVILHLDR